ncbi:MAG: sigma-70 family RNA polymerase sigma factor [Armatimonadetes bacterium]|nr:sigma-70 family RNA polymerase sigma factor [Armatimonadota bacterium]
MGQGVGGPSGQQRPAAPANGPSGIQNIELFGGRDNRMDMICDNEIGLPRPTPAVDEDRRLTFDELVAKYDRKIYNLIFRLVGDREEAADLTQETFVNAYRAFHRFRGEARVYTWLHQIAVNQCKNHFKLRARQRRHEAESLDAPVEEDGEALSREIPDWSHSPHQVVEQKELQAQIQKAIESLPEEYRVAVVLRDIQGLAYQEIATIMDLSLEAVKSRIFRGRETLRRKLGPYIKG